jgi:hypothetical protein
LRDRPRRYLLLSVGTIFRTDRYKGKEVNMVLKHMAIESDSSSSTFSNMLSMGGDLKDERENGHMEFKDHLHHKMLIILFPC